VYLQFLQTVVECDEIPEQPTQCFFFAVSEDPRKCTIDSLDFALFINEHDGLGNARKQGV
jgi:hypothetical protein